MLEIWLLLVASGPQFAHALTAEAATRVRGDISRVGATYAVGAQLSEFRTAAAKIVDAVPQVGQELRFSSFRAWPRSPTTHW